jgi:ABC-type transport system involved in multi-copper enzyme maturation permease subunit
VRPAAGVALWTLARVALIRVFRGRMLWIAVVTAVAPLPFAFWLRGRQDALANAFTVARLLLAILPPWLVAASIGEELEQPTYLWSRPLPRWTIIAGKLLALGPVATALTCASWMGAAALATSELPSARSIAALASGGLAISAVAAGIASLVPRHAMALAIVYALFDLLAGELPVSLHSLSMTHHVKLLSGVAGAPGTDVIALALIPIVWAALGVYRVSRREA